MHSSWVFRGGALIYYCTFIIIIHFLFIIIVIFNYKSGELVVLKCL